MITDNATDAEKKLAVELGIVAARLPHGQRQVTIQKLIALAPRQARAALLLNLILAGEEIDIKLIAAGVSEVLEAAKTETWILTQSDAYQLRVWLRLLPFADDPVEALPIVRHLPDGLRSPHVLEEMVSALADSPSNDAEGVLFKLAEEDPRFYANHRWRETALRMRSFSAALRFIDLTAEGVFNTSSTDAWQFARQIGALIGEHPQLRSHICDLLKDGPTSPGLALLAQAFAESPDLEGLLLLVKFEMQQKRPLVGWHTLEEVVTEHVPSENWRGAYDVLPVLAVELRKRLLGMTTTGGTEDTAARCLTLIDQLRDRYGAPESEPRHPDLSSGRPWPIMTPDPEAEGAESPRKEERQKRLAEQEQLLAAKGR